MDKFTNSVVDYIRKNNMLYKGDAVIVGFSGGADSACLLHVLNNVKQLLGIDLYAVHVNHNLRGEESLRDMNFCTEAARKLGVFTKVHSYDVAAYAKENKMTIEEAGRKLRYDAFNALRVELLKDCRYNNVYIATAHHANDKAETVLMNMCRGTGIKGLASIECKNMSIIRPLLATSRADIEDWMNAKGYKYVTDSTNLSSDYTRNYIRNEILPGLKENVNERTVEHIVKLADCLSEVDKYIDRQAYHFCCGYTETIYGTDSVSCLVERAVLKCQDPVLQKYVIRRMIREVSGSLYNITERHMESVMKALDSKNGFCIHLPEGLKVLNKDNKTVIKKVIK